MLEQHFLRCVPEKTGPAWALGPNRDLHFLRTRAGNLHPGSLWESATAHSEKVLILPVAEVSAWVHPGQSLTYSIQRTLRTGNGQMLQSIAQRWESLPYTGCS